MPGVIRLPPRFGTGWRGGCERNGKVIFPSRLPGILPLLISSLSTRLRPAFACGLHSAVTERSTEASWSWSSEGTFRSCTAIMLVLPIRTRSFLLVLLSIGLPRRNICFSPTCMALKLPSLMPSPPRTRRCTQTGPFLSQLLLYTTGDCAPCQENTRVTTHYR